MIECGERLGKQTRALCLDMKRSPSVKRWTETRRGVISCFRLGAGVGWRERERERERQTDRQTDRQIETETDATPTCKVTPDYHLLLHPLPPLAPAAVVVVVVARLDHVGQVADVANGQTQRVHLGQSPLRLHVVRDARAQQLEGVVDRLHAPPLSHVGGLPLHHLLHRAFPVRVVVGEVVGVVEGGVQAVGVGVVDDVVLDVRACGARGVQGVVGVVPGLPKVEEVVVQAVEVAAVHAEHRSRAAHRHEPRFTCTETSI